MNGQTYRWTNGQTEKHLEIYIWNYIGIIVTFTSCPYETLYSSDCSLPLKCPILLSLTECRNNKHTDIQQKLGNYDFYRVGDI